MASTSALAMRASVSVFRGRVNPMNGSEANKVYMESGAIRPSPGRTRYAVLKVASVVIPGLWIGALLSKTGADLMEKHDIFRPAEDDDWMGLLQRRLWDALQISYNSAIKVGNNTN